MHEAAKEHPHRGAACEAAVRRSITGLNCGTRGSILVFFLDGRTMPPPKQAGDTRNAAPEEVGDHRKYRQFHRAKARVPDKIAHVHLEKTVDADALEERREQQRRITETDNPSADRRRPEPRAV